MEPFTIGEQPSIPSGRSSRAGWIEALVVLTTCLVAIWARHRAPDWLIDDSFISYRYAKNLIEGKGLVFNSGEYVEGYTNFLWVLLAALGMKLGFEIVTFMRLIENAAFIGIVALVTLAVLRAPFTGKRGRLVVPFLLSLLFVPNGFVEFVGTGMETYLAALLLLAFAMTHHGDFARHRSLKLPVALLPCLMVLTRPDFALFLAVSVLVDILADREARLRALRRALVRLAPSVVLIAAHAAWKFWYYGAGHSNTYYAKAADQWHLRAGAKFVIAYVAGTPFIAAMIAAALLAISAAWRSTDRRLFAFGLLSLATYTAYVIKVGGDYMEYRFFYQVYPLALVVFALSLAHAPKSAPAQTALVSLCIALAFAPKSFDLEHGVQPMAEMDGYARTGIAVGKGIRERLPPDTIISTTLAGTVPFYSGLLTIDRWGLNDRRIGRGPAVQPHLVRGHMKFGTQEYLVERRVNLDLVHPIVCSCSNPCIEPESAQVFIRLNGDQCLRATYVVPTDALTALFCRDTASFPKVTFRCTDLRGTAGSPLR